jgi:hypothetical protein
MLCLIIFLVLKVLQENGREELDQDKVPDEHERDEVDDWAGLYAAVPHIVKHDIVPAVSHQYLKDSSGGRPDGVKVGSGGDAIHGVNGASVEHIPPVLDVFFDAVSEELHPEETVGEHHDQEQDGVVSHVFDCVPDLDDHDLKALPTPRQLEYPDHPEGSEGRHDPLPARLRRSQVVNHLNQTHYDYYEVKPVEFIIVVQLRPQSQHLTDHLHHKEPCQHYVYLVIDSRLILRHGMSIQS